MSILIQGGRIIDPSQSRDASGDLLIAEGRIVEATAGASADQVIDARGLIVCPGLVDVHVALREPGYEEDETTASGTSAALAGGFTTIACLPDTNPVVDDRGAAEFIALQAERANNCNVLPLGAVTRNCEGHELAEIGQLVEGGAVGFTDARLPVADAEVMRRALEYTRMFDCPILNRPQVPELSAKGVMHEGFISMLLGLPGIPSAAQDIMVSRDIALAEMTDGRVHLMCLTTEYSIEHVRQAKRRGLKVTCDVTPHHLALTDECLRSFDAHYKVDPPLRPQRHIEALIAGLKDDTIDVISSDHQPLAREKKQVELDLAPPGIVGLETVLPICIRTLIEPGHLQWPQLISKLTTGPASVLGIDKGTLAVGADADVCLIDPQVEWTIDPNQFASKSRNTPFGDEQVKGRAHTVIVGGEVRFCRAAND